MGSNEATGAFSVAEPLEKHDKEVFAKAMEGLVGVEYTPDLVSKQIVQGVNYDFICKYKTVTAQPEEGGAVVSIFEELPAYGGKVTITNILRFLL